MLLPLLTTVVAGRWKVNGMNSWWIALMYPHSFSPNNSLCCLYLFSHCKFKVIFIVSHFKSSSLLQPTTFEPWHWHFLILLLFVLCKKDNTTYATCLACTFKSLGFWPDCCSLPADCFFLSDWTIFRFILKSTEHSNYLLYTALAIIEKQTVQITEVDKEQRTWTGHGQLPFLHIEEAFEKKTSSWTFIIYFKSLRTLATSLPAADVDSPRKQTILQSLNGYGLMPVRGTL